MSFQPVLSCCLSLCSCLLLYRHDHAFFFFFCACSLSEEQAAFEKAVSAMKADHEAELQAAAEKLQQSSSDGKRAKM